MNYAFRHFRCTTGVHDIKKLPPTIPASGGSVSGKSPIKIVKDMKSLGVLPSPTKINQSGLIAGNFSRMFSIVLA